MAVVVNLGGAITPPEEARVSAFDRGLLFGDGIYESCRTYGGRLFMLGAHLRRLRRSAGGIGLTGLPDDETLAAEVARTVAAAGNAESRVRIVVTRGVSDPFTLVPEGDGPPTVMIIAAPQPAPVSKDDGVDVVIPQVRALNPRALPGWIKSNGRLVQINALAEGRRRGAWEVILLDEAGFVAEGATSNVFFMRGDVLCTPAVSVGILPGLTRSVVLGLARQAGVPTKTGTFRPGDVMGADEVFLTGNMKELVPVRRVDGQPVHTCPGPVTRALQDSYTLLARRFAAGELGDEEIEALIDDDSAALGAEK